MEVGTRVRFKWTALSEKVTYEVKSQKGEGSIQVRVWRGVQAEETAITQAFGPRHPTDFSSPTEH